MTGNKLLGWCGHLAWAVLQKRYRKVAAVSVLPVAS